MTIRDAAHAAMRGAVAFGPPPQRGYCLRFVRQVIEFAFGWPEGEFYRRHGTHRTTGAPWPREDTSWWAADLERSLREQRLGYAPGEGYVLPGSLAFSHSLAKPYGHVGIVLEGGMVLEAINPAHRPRGLARGDLVLSHLGAWPSGPTLIANISPGGIP